MKEFQNPIDLKATQQMINDAMQNLSPSAREYVKELLNKAAKGDLKEGLTMADVQKIANKVVNLQNQDIKTK